MRILVENRDSEGKNVYVNVRTITPGIFVVRSTLNPKPYAHVIMGSGAISCQGTMVSLISPQAARFEGSWRGQGLQHELLSILLKGGLYRGLYRGLLQGILRGILGV